MRSELRVDSAIKILLLGANHSEQLKQYAIKYICRYIDQIVDTQEFIELNQNHSDLVCEIVTQLKSDLDNLKKRVSAWLCAKVINDLSIRRLVMGNENDCRLTGEGCNFMNEYSAEIISSDEFQKLTDERSDLNSEIFSTFDLSLADLKKRLLWKGDNELILTKIKRVQVYMSDQDCCVR